MRNPLSVAQSSPLQIPIQWFARLPRNADAAGDVRINGSACRTCTGLLNAIRPAAEVVQKRSMERSASFAF